MRARNILRPVLHRILPPLTRRYLRKPRKYRYDGLDLIVQPGVFHPGLYFSTRLMIKHLRDHDLQGQTLLELGAGSGLISLWCARAGAAVTATDINPTAVANIRENAEKNDIKLEVLESDLFAALGDRRFDYIIINPPYYPGTPENDEQHAWYCGPEFEYFSRLFAEMPAHRTVHSTVLMVLSEDCDIDRIQALATKADWDMEVRHVEKKWWEWNYIYACRYKRL